MSSPRVLVVGGGLAGLSAAVACADAGSAVTLFESKAWLGGATASFVREGLAIDTGQHVFLRCCTAYRGFLDRLGVSHLTRLQPKMDIPVVAPGRRAARLRRTGLPAPLHLGAALARYPFLSAPEKAHLVRASLALRRLDPADRSLDQRSFGSWLRDTGQSERAVRYLWDLFGLPTLNIPAEQASLALAAKVFRTGLLDRADAADVGVAGVSLSDLHGRPAERTLTSLGARVLHGARVRGVRMHDGAAAGVVLDDGSHVAGDAVIVAVPWDRVDALLPPGTAGGFDRLGQSPIVNVHVVYDRPVTGLEFVAAVDSPVQWVFDRTSAAGLEHGQYLAISLSGADDMVDRPVEWFRRTFVPALEDLFPRARAARVERFLVTRERGATFRQVPGSAALRPGHRTLVRGLFLAGAWTDTGWPATMEGAVRSGQAAARAALAAAPRPALAEVAP